MEFGTNAARLGHDGRVQITIPSRYCGPATSGNGGWTAGSLAAAVREDLDVGSPVTVRLSAPPPLDRPLEVRAGGDAVLATLGDGSVTIATATAAGPWTADPVPYVDPATAAATASGYATDEHPFPHCFVCGPARLPGDGMRLTPGPLSAGRSACLWRPADTQDGPVTEPAVWAALDCPGGWASDIVGRPMVLGTMTAQVLAPVPSEQTHVVTGRLDSESGRVSRTSSSLWSTDGVLLARAEAVWVRVDASVFDRILS